MPVLSWLGSTCQADGISAMTANDGHLHLVKMATFPKSWRFLCCRMNASFQFPVVERKHSQLGMDTNLDRLADCRPIMLQKMEYMMEHPEEASKVKGLQRQVQEVQEIMKNNIEQVSPQ